MSNFVKNKLQDLNEKKKFRIFFANTFFPFTFFKGILCVQHHTCSVHCVGEIGRKWGGGKRDEVNIFCISMVLLPRHRTTWEWIIRDG